MSWSSRGECMAVGVKAHVMFSGLLSEDDYWNLLGSDTVSEVGRKLRSSSYGEAMSAMPDEMHRRDIEAAIKNSLMDEAESFLCHMSSPRDKFFRAFTRKHEADNLKSVFRHIASGKTDRESLRRRLYLSKNSKISYDNALAARDFAELSEALRGSPYHKILEEPLRRLKSGEERSLFPLEMALDLFVELSQYKALKKLDRAERDRLWPIFGVRIDLWNVYLLYRSLKFYNLTPEETLNRLMPVRYRVAMKDLREMARASTLEDAKGAFAEKFPAYAEVFSGGGDAHAELAIERNIKRRIYSQARRVFAGAPPGFHTAVAYYELKENEIADIIRIIECVRYGHDRRAAAAYLTRPITPAGGGETEWR